MQLELLEKRVACAPYRFVTKQGEPIEIVVLPDECGGRLIDAYLAYEPRDCFQGLPPLKDDVCVKWVEHLLRECVNLVATATDDRIVGHVAVVPMANDWWEMLVSVWPPFQNLGIGTELVRRGIAQARRLGAEGVLLTVETTHCRARHVYEKCGFHCVCANTQDARPILRELTMSKRL